MRFTRKSARALGWVQGPPRTAGEGHRPAHWGDALQAIRQRAGRSRADVAAAAGLQAGYLAKLESGGKPLTAASLDAILDALGVTIFDVQAVTETLPPQARRAAAPPWPWWAERRDASASLRRADRARARARATPPVGLPADPTPAGGGLCSTPPAASATIGSTAWPPNGSRTTSAIP